ncbi:MAG TPA: HD domain-containing phosphohydrolase [Blastocatellia bacterium]|nr:HD domain-containing phosphohydrolase [Blastocatellia bacterium]
METARGKTREETINRLADRIDTFEKYTQPHSRLMTALATSLARRFGLAPADVEAIAEAAMLHDIGLYAMSPAYLSLTRPLSFEARLDLWRHPVIGEQQMSKRDAGRHAQLLVRWHHEWWNGSGYPDMLAFEDIPIGARILRAVELYCALLGDRPYRNAVGKSDALEALTSSGGIECDPYVVKALLALLDEAAEPTNEQFIAQSAEPDSAESESGPKIGLPINESLVTEPSAFVHDPERSNIEQRDESAIVFSDEASSAPNPWRSSNETIAPTLIDPTVNQSAMESLPVADTTQATEAPPSQPRSAELLFSRVRSTIGLAEAGEWRGWRASSYNKKTLLGFQASVLRQIEFRSIAIPYWNDARLDLYLKAWAKVILANDPRAWASTVARARVEAGAPITEEVITHVLQDVYVPGARLANPDLRRWFSETDAWWMDNLRGNIDGLEDQLARAQAMTLGLQTGDYALSFDDETRELRRPLTTVFWRLAGRAIAGPASQPNNRSFCMPVEEFMRQARADVLFLSLPSGHTDTGGAEARNDWRESWVNGAAAEKNQTATSQSKQSHLDSIERLLRLASNYRTWAIEYQEPGLASAQDLLELIKEYRQVRASYSKDVTEVAGGLRSYIIVGEKSSR